MGQKTLKFDASEESKIQFSLLYQGFLMGAPEGGLKGLEQHRRAHKIMEKLEKISEIVKDRGTKEDGTEEERVAYYQTGDVVRALKDAGGKLVLEEEEAKMLKEHIDAVPWRVQASKHVVALADKLE